MTCLSLQEHVEKTWKDRLHTREPYGLNDNRPKAAEPSRPCAGRGV